MKIDHSRFYRYEQLAAVLRGLAAEHPGLARLHSIGRSYQGRDILVMEITDVTTGPAASKPAMYVEGNMHAGEVTGSAVCLYTAQYLLENFVRDQRIRRLLGQTAFYINPRVSPDGAEYYLTTPQSVRSSVRPYPTADPDEPRDGLVPEDVDGDGIIRQMRVADPSGEWKVSLMDARLMTRRSPGETGGPYYRLFAEGRLYRDGKPWGRHVRPAAVKAAPGEFGLDFNRNYPASWSPEERGAGPYPLSEPETRAVADFVLAHPNIGVIMSYHTSGGVIIRPFSTKPDDAMSRRDLAVYTALGRLGREETGYAAVSVFTGLNRGRFATHGDFKDWAYEHRGVIIFTTELWDAAARAGLKRGPDWYVEQGDEAERLLLKWNDETLGGRFFKNWTAFDHPELGHVEVGGWDRKGALQNPPPEYLEDECRRNAMFTFRQAEALPHLALVETTVSTVCAATATAGRGAYRVRVLVTNDGYLPTNITEQALKMGTARPVVLRLEVPEGVRVLSPEGPVSVGHLEGTAGRATGWSGGGGTAGASSEAAVEWLVEGPPGARLVVVARSPRAGTVGTGVVLP